MTAGIRFRIYPQAEGWNEPETIVLAAPRGGIGPGPHDAAMRAILPVRKVAPYDPPAYAPPYTGLCHDPARPDATGGFDHIPTSDPAFLPAHIYACVRHTLHTWERHLHHRITWWHADAYPQMELVALVDWDNAQSGAGFIEAGGKRNRAGQMRLFCLNFDVMAHETGHAILFSTMGAPPGRPTAAFLAFHESFADLVSMIAVLDFPSVIDRLLRQTGGNLHALNMLNRLGEMSGSEQVRIADNTVTMADVASVILGADGTWVDLAGQDRNAHAVAQPLTGAMFDILVELFQDRLLRDGIDVAHVAAHPAAFRAALMQARDTLAFAMGRVMLTLLPTDLTFDRLAACVLDALACTGAHGLLPRFLAIFLRRGIDPRRVRIHPHDAARVWRRLPYAERARRVAAAHIVPCGCDHAGAAAANRMIRQAHQRSRILHTG